MTGTPPVPIAIYDLDRTITSLPTWTPFLIHAAWKLAPWRLALAPAVGAAALGARDRDRRKEAMHRLLIGTRDPERLAVAAESFADRIVRDHIRPGARVQLAADRKEGRRIVIATAAHRFYARAIADRLGIADLIATEARRDAAGCILPQLDGPNCYGSAKQAMIARWLADAGIDRADAHIRFYSDHASDRPTFEWVDEAVAVNPHAALRRLAAERGWRSVDW